MNSESSPDSISLVLGLKTRASTPGEREDLTLGEEKDEAMVPSQEKLVQKEVSQFLQSIRPPCRADWSKDSGGPRLLSYAHLSPAI